MHGFLSRTVLTAILLAVSNFAFAPANAQTPGANRVLTIVLDGCRPDYVTPEIMPNVYALGQRGVVCTNNHSVFPTLTRVNATSLATGCYPAKHGLMGNTVYFPSVEPSGGLSTGSATKLMRIADGIDERLVTRPTLGEVLEENGKTLLAVSSGSPGSAYLLNNLAKGAGIINVELTLPESRHAHIDEVLGPVPEEAYPNAEQNHWIVDAYLKLGLEKIHPDVTTMWLSDPDHTAHAKGIGDPVTLEALKAVDSEIGRILGALEHEELLDKTNIIVTSDHGFSTHTGKTRLAPFLVEKGLKASASSTDVIVVDGCIYVENHDAGRIENIVEVLQHADWVGAIFTRGKEPSSDQGSVPGTLSLGLAHFDHDRAPDILVDANWSDAANEHGWKGTTDLPGVAGHGTSSPFDIHNTLIVAGPAFKQGKVSDTPTGNIDMMPTICALAGVPVPDGVDGRVLTELLQSDNAPPSPTVETRTYEAHTKNGDYSVTLHESQVGSTRYMDFTKTQRR